jgi:hypothetical protein
MVNCQVWPGSRPDAWPRIAVSVAAGDRLRAVRQSHFREQREQGALFLRVEVAEQAAGVEMSSGA